MPCRLSSWAWRDRQNKLSYFEAFVIFLKVFVICLPNRQLSHLYINTSISFFVFSLFALTSLTVLLSHWQRVQIIFLVSVAGVMKICGALIIRSSTISLKYLGYFVVAVTVFSCGSLANSAGHRVTRTGLDYGPGHQTVKGLQSFRLRLPKETDQQGLWLVQGKLNTRDPRAFSSNRARSLESWICCSSLLLGY